MKFLLPFVAALFATAQGLPEYGVLLEGTVDAPRIVNNSAHRILFFALQFDNRRGTSSVNFLVQFRQNPSAGIAPGATYEMPQRGATQTRDAGGGLPPQPTSAGLDAVLFADGHLVGPDHGGMFNNLTAQIKAEQDVAAILLNTTDRNAAWAQIQNIANSPPELPALPRGGGGFLGALPPGRPQFARQLLLQRSAGGEAAAIKLAESTRNYPVIVKGE